MSITVPPAVAAPKVEPKSFAARLAIAYEHYRYVTQAQIEAFNERLKRQTLKRFGNQAGRSHGGNQLYSKYDVLDLSPWEKYEGQPPADVIQAVEAAKALGVFDVLEVAKIKSEVEYHDPIVFGRVLGCGDRFFIAQWDHDVQIEDILQPNEG